MRKPPKAWTQEEDQYLRDNVNVKTISDMSRELDRARAVITNRMKKLGIETSGEVPGKWKPEEDAYLLEHFEHATKKEIMEHFHYRTWPSIIQHAHNLGLKKVSQNRTNIDYNFFETWNPTNAYYFGLILTDGYIIYSPERRTNKNAYLLYIGLNVRDEAILERMRADMKMEAELIHKPSRPDIADLIVRNAKICQDLFEKGMPVDQKSLTAEFPPNVPEECVPHLIRGIFDGDGSIMVRDGRIHTCICGTEKLMNQICDILSEKVFNGEYRPRVERKGLDQCWEFRMAHNNSLKFLHWIYADTSLFITRKYMKFIENA